jgi:hypothetical protein
MAGHFLSAVGDLNFLFNDIHCLGSSLGKPAGWVKDKGLLSGKRTAARPAVR